MRSPRLRRPTLIIALLLAASAAAPAPASAQRKIAERYPATPDGFVRIQNLAGSVKVVGWDRDSISITGTVHDTPAERFGVARSGDGVKLGIWDITAERAEPSHFEVRVPARSRVWVRTGSASIFVGGVTGGLDVTSVGGDIEVAGAPSDLFAESMTGRIVLEARSRLARAKTVTGSIRVNGAISDLTATSVSGNVLIENAQVERGSFESVDGELRFVGRIQRGATLDFVTHGGAVELLLPSGSDAEFRISTFEGGLANEFKTQVRTTASKVKGSEHTFTLGSGGAHVNVRTFRGRTVVRSR